MAAPPDSHASGNLAQDFFCSPSQLKTEGQSEETAQETTDHNDFKPDQTSSSPLLPSPDSELYWSPWLYTDLIILDHQSGSSALTCSLPPFPHCPGPLLISDPSPVHRPQMSSTFSQEHPQLAAIYQAVQAVGTPNYRGARQPVPHNLNIPAWRDRAHLFPDASLVQMLEFGFHIGYTASHPPAPHTGNHPSANKHPADIDAYLNKELRHSAIIGPADHLPFQWPRTNPMMTRPKKDSSSRRVIVDLSMPQDASVNSGIPRNSLDGAPFKLRLPNPATLAAKILEYGPGCLLYKVDLSRAYRQLRTDPLDWPFLMLQWDDQHYLDISIPFRLRHGASACQRTTEAVSAIAKEEARADTAPYIDDTIGAALPQDAWPHYHHLLDLMSQTRFRRSSGQVRGSNHPHHLDRSPLRYHTPHHGHRSCQSGRSPPILPRLDVRQFHSSQEVSEVLRQAVPCHQVHHRSQDLLQPTIGRPRHGKSWFHLPRPPGQGRHSLVPVFPRSFQWGHTHQTFRCTARHPRGFLSTGRRRALLRSPVLQDQLPTVPRGFRPLHLQSRMLESPGGRQDLAAHTVRYHSPRLLRQLGHSRSHKLRKSYRPDHQRFPPGTLVACRVPRRPTGSSAQARSRHDHR